MLYSDKVKLVTVVQFADEAGYPEEEQRTELEVFGDVRSATRAEFYAALEVGAKADIMVEVSIRAWNKARVEYESKKVLPSIVIINGEEFDIKRDFAKSREKIELTCTRRG